MFDAIKIAGAAFLLWLAWCVLRPGAVATLVVRGLRPAPASTLFCMGFLVNLLNPKAVLFYVALLPQFLHPDRGALMVQTFQLGAVQVVMSGAVMGALVCGVSRLQPLLSQVNGAWQRISRYLMGGLFAALAIRLLMVRMG